MSPTGSKTGRPFLANGPRGSTRVGEPSRRSRLTLLESRFQARVPAQRSRVSEFLRAKWRVSIPSSFSLRAPLGHQRGFECGAGVPVRIP